jgi:hypothetical protein
MDLGNILSRRGGTPVSGRPVKFKVLYRDEKGRLHICEAEAVLMPVDEETRTEVYREAALRCDAEGGPPLHEERTYALLQVALRDPEKVESVFADSTTALRKALVGKQVDYLSDEYLQLLRDQYPELAPEPPAQPPPRKELEAQAKVFTPGVQR